MDLTFFKLLPFVLLLSRVAAFITAAPVFGSPIVPMPVKAGLALWVTTFFAVLIPPRLHAIPFSGVGAGMLVVQEIIIGLALGLAARLVFAAVQQGGAMIAQDMGMTDIGVVDPTSGEESESVGTFLEMGFTIAFLSLGGHQLLIMLLARSYKVFPLAGAMNITSLAEGLIAAGSAMLLFGLKLAAPLIAAFLILSLMLAIISRGLPDLNVFFESYPLRVGLGLVLMAAIMPAMNTLTIEIMDCMSRFLSS